MLVGGEGTPTSHGGGYPIQSWWGVPQPVMVGGTPSSHGGGTPSSHGGEGVPQVPPHHPDLAGGEYPRYPLHHPDLARGGTPQDPDLGWGTPHHPDLGWGTPLPIIQTWDGVPPIQT